MTNDPRLLQGAWMLHRPRLDALLSARPVTRGPATTGPADAAQQPAKPYQVRNGVALLALTGVMTKQPDWLAELFGLGGTSTAVVAAAFAMAQDDPSVAATYLYVDSPGGEAAGTAELADLIAAAEKPTVAFVSDMAGSGAYYVASQADEVYANAAGWVGSIGCYSVLYDMSKAASDQGVTVNVVKAGEHKGDGYPGSPVTAGQLTEEQRIVDTIAGQFIDAVTRGRGLPRASVAAMATGQMWVAADAQAMGLIDGIATADQVFQMVLNMSTQQTNTPPGAPATAATAPATAAGSPALEDFTARLAIARTEGHAAGLVAGRTEGHAAGVAAERERFTDLADMAGEHPAFVMEQFKAGANVTAAAKAYGTLLKGQAQQARTLDPSNGVPALNVPQTAGTDSEDPERTWDQNVGGVRSQFKTKTHWMAFADHAAKVAARQN